MDNRDTSLLLPVTKMEKEFLIECAEKACLSLSDFILLSALAANIPKRKQRQVNYPIPTNSIKGM